jgi:hypothetical protein
MLVLGDNLRKRRLQGSCGMLAGRVVRWGARLIVVDLPKFSSIAHVKSGTIHPVQDVFAGNN